MTTSTSPQPSLAAAHAPAADAADPLARRQIQPARRQIRTFKPRRGRITGAQAGALERLWPRWGFAIRAEGGSPLDLAALFGRTAPVELEIGCGMGAAVIALASANPEHDFLAVDVHTPGLGNVLRLAERAGLTNVRVASGDALDLLCDQVPAGVLEAVHVYFPDPWPKARHHKRRIVRGDVAALLADRLRPGGLLHCATDWAAYAEEMREVLDAEPRLESRYPGYAPRPTHRPVTKFEARAVRDGREVFDLCYARV